MSFPGEGRGALNRRLGAVGWCHQKLALTPNPKPKYDISPLPSPPRGLHSTRKFGVAGYTISALLSLLLLIEDVSINNEYEYESDLKPYSYPKSFSQLSMLAMTPSSSL